ERGASLHFGTSGEFGGGTAPLKGSGRCSSRWAPESLAPLCQPRERAMSKLLRRRAVSRRDGCGRCRNCRAGVNAAPLAAAVWPLCRRQAASDVETAQPATSQPPHRQPRNAFDGARSGIICAHPRSPHEPLAMQPVRLALVFLALQVVAPQAGPLRVLRVTPTSPADPNDVVTVTFDRPVAGGLDATVDPQSIFSIEPAVAGRVEWRDPVTLRFTPSKPLEPGASYTITLTPNFTAMDGSRLDRPYTHTFRVSPPRVLG